MASLNAFLVAVEMAERKRDEARQWLYEVRNGCRAAQAQFDQLEGYAQETQGRWGMRADATLKPEVMFHHYRFMERLSHAIAMQSGVLNDHVARVEAATRSLRDAELRVASLQKVVDKRRRELALLHGRREQKQTDERAALQFRNVSNGPMGREW